MRGSAKALLLGSPGGTFQLALAATSDEPRADDFLSLRFFPHKVSCLEDDRRAHKLF